MDRYTVILIIIFAVFLSIPSLVIADTYYVVSTGSSPNGDGSVGDPWQTFDSITWGTLSAGDTLDGNDNTYGSQLAIAASGGSGNHITIQNLTIDNPGAHSITLWNQQYVTLYDITLSNNTSYDGILIAGNISLQQGITISSCDISGQIKGVTFTANNNHNIADIIIEDSTIYDNSSDGIRWNTGDADVDEDGYVTGVTISGNTIYGNDDGIRAWAISGASGDDDYSSDITVYNNDIYNNDDYGLRLDEITDRDGVTTVSYNTIYNNGLNPGTEASNGLWLGAAAGAIVEYNEVYNNHTGTGAGFYDGMGIWIDHGSDSCTVRYNEVYNNTDVFDKAPFGAGTQGNSAGIAVYDSTNAVIHHNLVYGNTTGLRLSLDASAVVYNNVFAGNRIGISYKGTLAGNIFKNNIIANNDLEGDGETDNWGFYYSPSYTETPVSDYNNLYNNQQNSAAHVVGNNSLTSDPLLTVTYSIQSNSPAKDAGDNSVWSGTANVLDYDGTAITDSGGDIVAPGGIVDFGALENITVTGSSGFSIQGGSFN